jgi:hypothetical protein
MRTIFRVVMKEPHEQFKARFWEWFDNLPPKAKQSYMYAYIDVAEEYFKEFFYNNGAVADR